MLKLLLVFAVILAAANAHIAVTVAGRTAVSVPVSLILIIAAGLLAYAMAGRFARRVRHAFTW